MSEAAPSPRRPVVVVIAGPTAVGKSSVAMELCRRLGRTDGGDVAARLLSADSVQAYVGPSVGANKPSRGDRAAIRHELLDLWDDGGVRTAADWHVRAVDALRDCAAVGDVPVVAGGTMMYVQWLVRGKPDVSVPTAAAVGRAEALLAGCKERDGPEGWHEAVAAVAKFGGVFAERARGIEFGDWYRLQRTAETALSTEGTAAAATAYTGQRTGGLEALGYDARCFFLCPDDRVAHAAAIDGRCEQMVTHGLLPETVALKRDGKMPPDGVLAKAIGYRQALDYLQRPAPVAGHASSFEEFISTHMSATRRYSQQQMKWFRKDRQFVFVPVSTAAAPAERTAAAADIIANMVRMERGEYEAELLSAVGPAGAADGGGAPVPTLSEETRRRNEQQGKDMKRFMSVRTALSAGSGEFVAALAEADACTARMQGLPGLPEAVPAEVEGGR